MKRIPECHPDRPHRCRGMCSACYQRYKASSGFVKIGRPPQATSCGHQGKMVGHGKCPKCYTKWLRDRDGAAGKEKRRADRITAVYGITSDQFELMRSDQGDRCALCRRVFASRKNIHIDHCHESGRVRGLLCFSCNKALGMLGDNRTGLQRALAYVQFAPILMRKMDEKLSDRCGLISREQARAA